MTLKSFKKKLSKLLAEPEKPSFLIAPTPGLSIDLERDAEGFFDGAQAAPMVISYGTRDGKYDAFADRLRQSCEASGMACSIETMPPCGRDNSCLFKPAFIKFKLLTQNRPIIWLDADAVLDGAIELPEGGWDIGTVSNNVRNEINEKASVCVAFRPTVRALRFIEMWEQLCSAHWLEPGLDHRRFNYTRAILRERFTEADIGPAISAKLVRDAGKDKEFRY